MLVKSTDQIIKTNEPAKEINKSLEETNQQQKSVTLNRINKIASVKPPPPSTKIPKSAVVMPDGSSSSFNLDVQFGVDLEPS